MSETPRKRRPAKIEKALTPQELVVASFSALTDIPAERIRYRPEGLGHFFQIPAGSPGSREPFHVLHLRQLSPMDGKKISVSPATFKAPANHAVAVTRGEAVIALLTHHPQGVVVHTTNLTLLEEFLRNYRITQSFLH